MSNSWLPYGLQPARLLCPQGFSRQECWCGLPYLPPGYLPNPGIKPRSPALQADSFPAETPRKPSVPKRSTKSITAVLKCGHGRKKLKKDKIPVWHSANRTYTSPALGTWRGGIRTSCPLDSSVWTSRGSRGSRPMWPWGDWWLRSKRWCLCWDSMRKWL